GDLTSNYDLPSLQPKEKPTPTARFHTLQLLLADLLRDRLDGIIDCSPFGCRTGFHLITWGVYSSTEVAKALKEVLEIVANESKWENVQGVDIKSCGNYSDHSLFTAKEYDKLVLEQGISDDPFERHIV